MRVPAGCPHFNQSPNPTPKGDPRIEAALIENLLITPQVKLASDEANCKSGCNSKEKWTNGIMEYTPFSTARFLTVSLWGGGGALGPAHTTPGGEGPHGVGHQA